MDGQLNQNSA